jgi:hypothetical protein
MSEAKKQAALSNLDKAAAANGAYLASLPRWSCATCGATRPATVHQRRQTYCSKSCMAAGYRARMVGEANPNHSGAGAKVCERCGDRYHSYNKARRFCSQECYQAARPAAPMKQMKLRLVKPEPIPKDRPARMEKTCLQCGASFKLSPCQSGRLYCSYACHLASGGAFRAGIAARQATMKYGAKKDANHGEVFDALRKHCAVYDFSAAGCGLPDGIAWVGGEWRLFDVKNPKTGYGRRGLNKVQKKWLAQWKGGPVYLIHSTDEAERFGRGEFDGIKFVTPESAAAAIGVTA